MLVMLPVDDKAFGQQEEEHSTALALVIRGEINIWLVDSFFMDKFSSISFLVVDLTGTQISTHLQMARNLTMLRKKSSPERLRARPHRYAAGN